MGYRGTTNTLLNFGEGVHTPGGRGGAVGYLVGEEHQGLTYMFHMMNEARIGVGMGATVLGYTGYLHALEYARTRTQGRPAAAKTMASKDVASPAVPIIEHPDVRRMLLTMKATTEGARVLAYETAFWVDVSHHHPDEKVREEAQDWVDLNTPLVKAFCTDSAVELASMAIQTYGGHGFIKEHGVEQIARDAKILCLYEGTNGIQAMDLVRRKLLMHNGRLAQRFFSAVRAELNAEAPLGWITRPLGRAVDELESATKYLIDSFKTAPDAAGFAAVDFQRAFALTYLGWNWLRMVKAVARHPEAGYRESKKATAEFFVTRMLPQVAALLGTVRAPTENQMALEAANF
jgi:hypothetical protein